MNELTVCKALYDISKDMSSCDIENYTEGLRDGLIGRDTCILLRELQPYIIGYETGMRAFLMMEDAKNENK